MGGWQSWVRGWVAPALLATPSEVSLPGGQVEKGSVPEPSAVYSRKRSASARPKYIRGCELLRVGWRGRTVMWQFQLPPPMQDVDLINLTRFESTAES